jgi:hypothetical protein
VTVAELHTYIESLPEVHAILGSPVLDETVEGDKSYRITLRLVSGIKVNHIHAYYWVMDEGLPTEEAWVWDRNKPIFESIVS